MNDKVIKKITYHHPVFDADAISAQAQLSEIQGINSLWFCGSYTGYGFHEDALASAVSVCKKLGASIPWETSFAKDSAKTPLKTYSAVIFNECNFTLQINSHAPQVFSSDV